MSLKLCIFGCGYYGKMLYEAISKSESGIQAIFCDKDSNKYLSTEYVVVSPAEAAQRLTEKKLDSIVIPGASPDVYKTEMATQLLELGVSPGSILYADMRSIVCGEGFEDSCLKNMSYSCFAINNAQIVFSSQINTYNPIILICCTEKFSTIPLCYFGETPEETMQNYFELRKGLIDAGITLGRQGLAGKDKGCAICVHYQLGDWSANEENELIIRNVNLSTYPSPCQSKCIYCPDKQLNSFCEDDSIRLGYTRLFDTLEYATSNKMIAPDALWSIAPGEITIHPYKDKIYNLVAGYPTVFHTNCFIFDEKIAGILEVNPKASISFSIDSGTPETWLKVKGVNNFTEVLNNLQKYRSVSDSSQIRIKYIVLPGVNDSLPEFHSLVSLLSALRLSTLSISRDTCKKYTFSDTEREQLIKSTSCLSAIMNKNDIKTEFHNFTKYEQQAVIDQAQELLDN